MTNNDIEELTLVPAPTNGDADSVDGIFTIAGDTPSLVVSTTSLNVNEGGTNTFNVRLSAQPVSDVTVTIAHASGDTDLTVSGGATLVFTSVNWNTDQTVTLAAAEDVDLANGSAVFDVTSNGLTTVSVTATEVDNDNAATFGGNIFYNQDATAEKNFSLDQTGQRSMVRRIQVVFDGDVTVPTGAIANNSFQVTNTGTSANIGLTVASSTFAAGRTTVVLELTSGTEASGSLVDGDYRLVIDYGVLGIDGDGDSLVGGTRTVDFHRFFGDSDGDRDVDSRDAANYVRGLRGNASWRSVFDWDNDGSLLAIGPVQDPDDKAAFFANFGHILNPF